MDELRRYYELLEIPPGSTEAEVKRAYRELAQVWHPDRFEGKPGLQAKAHRKLQEINQAYASLLSIVPRPSEVPYASEPSPRPSAASAPPVMPGTASFFLLSVGQFILGLSVFFPLILSNFYMLELPHPKGIGLLSVAVAVVGIPIGWHLINPGSCT
jgi:preprotein translocase subunit Sec63